MIVAWLVSRSGTVTSDRQPANMSDRSVAWDVSRSGTVTSDLQPSNMRTRFVAWDVSSRNGNSCTVA